MKKDYKKNQVEFSVIEDKKERFLELIPLARRIDIVSAWATKTEIFEALVKRAEEANSLFLQMVIGTSSGGTDPKIFSILEKVSGANCKVPSHALKNTGIFHPKLYIFYGVNGEDIAIIGSMNFTHSGFLKNKELLIELKGEINELKEWFSEIWNNSNPISPEELEECQLAWKCKKDKDCDPGESVFEDGKALALRKRVFTSWRGYKKALKEIAPSLQEKMTKADASGMVLGKNDIWTRVLRDAEEVLKRKDWEQMCGRVLAGNYGPYKPFGTMQGNGTFCGVMVNSKDPEKRDRILKVLRRFQKLDVSNLSAEQKAEEVCKYLTELETIEPLKIAIATRLLTLTRPDLAFSYNGSSSKNLHLIGGIITDARTEENYKKLLIKFYSTEWYQSQEPKKGDSIWKNRMALIDLLVYEHNNENVIPNGAD